MSFKLPHDFIIIDGEFNEDDWVELGAVRFDRNGFLKGDTFQSLIRTDKEPKMCQTPRGNMTIAELTGIEWGLLRTAPEFKEVIGAFKTWAENGGKNFYLASWGAGDCFLLKKQCDDLGIEYPFRQSVRDVKSMVEFASGMLGVKFKLSSLRSFMKAWDVEWDSKYGEQHRALADAWNSAKLLQKVVKYFEDTKTSLKDVTQRLGS